jgi:hypothetical protein
MVNHFLIHLFTAVVLSNTSLSHVRNSLLLFNKLAYLCLILVFLTIIILNVSFLISKELLTMDFI